MLALAVALLAVAAGSAAASVPGRASSPAAADGEASRIVPFSGRLVTRERSALFDFLITKTPPGWESLRNEVKHFYLISSTLVFVDGAKARLSDLEVGQRVTVFFEVSDNMGLNLVAKRVEAYSVRDAKRVSPAMAAIAGSTYDYLKVLPNRSGHVGPRDKDKVRVTFFQDGRTAEVQWWFWSGDGCTLTQPTGRTFPAPQIADLVTSVNADGTFHGVDTRKDAPGVRSLRNEVYGRLASGYVQLRLRQKRYEVAPGGTTRCDGRWVSFRVPLQSRNAPPGSEPKPTVPEEGRYAGKVDGRSPISFTVVRDAQGRATVQTLQFKVLLQCYEGPATQGVTERLAYGTPLRGARLYWSQDSESGDGVHIQGDFDGRTASGTLSVRKPGCKSNAHTWAASRQSS